MYDLMTMMYGEKKEIKKKQKLSDVFVMSKKKSVVKNKKQKTNGKDPQGNKKKKSKA